MAKIAGRAALSGSRAVSGPVSSVSAVVLGAAQDGGVPHAGCLCARCCAALRDPSQRRLPACLGLVDRDAGSHWLVDATPALPEQWARLMAFAPATDLAGILLTHVHMGHCAGLVHLGPEAAATREVPLFASQAVCGWLGRNSPWSDLVAGGHVVLRPIERGTRSALSARLAVTALEVPHRAVHGDTVAFELEGPRRRLFYCPDTDAWSLWEPPLESLLADRRIDIALLDGTFLDPAELPHRAMGEVPHPVAAQTARAVGAAQCGARLIHLNHTNALWDGPVAGIDIPVAREGETFAL